MVSKDFVKPQKIEIIERKTPLKVMGCLFYGDPFHSKGEWSIENEIGLLWQRFGKLYEKHKEMIDRHRVDKGVAYEIHIQPKDYEETKKYYIFVGIKVKELNEMPIEMVGKVFEGTMYAIFTFKGEDMFNGGEYIWQDWLPNSSDYEEAFSYFIEAYDETRFFGLDSEDSEIDYYIPIRLKCKE